MSAPGTAKAKKDALASGAWPRPEGRVRERGWRPTRRGYEITLSLPEAARRCASPQKADARLIGMRGAYKEAEG
jgi:hypothetical protein